MKGLTLEVRFKDQKGIHTFESFIVKTPNIVAISEVQLVKHDESETILDIAKGTQQ